MTLVDYAGGYPGAANVKAAGHDGAVRYLVSSPERGLPNKSLTREEADDYKANGLQLVSNWQNTKADFQRGFNGGVEDARRALANHFTFGGPGYCPIFFSVDQDINLGTWNAVVVEYFRGVNSVIGVEWTGIYGASHVCAWAVEDGVVGKSTTPGKSWCWVTKAWSNGQVDESAVLYQKLVDTASNPGPKISGITVDVNDTLAADYGQWSIDRSPGSPPAPAGGVVAAQRYTEINGIGSSSHGRNGARIRNILWHTQEGNGNAETLAAYLNNSNNQVSYHYTVRDGIVVDVVDTDLCSWSVLDANPYTINLCFAGSFAAWSRAQWMQRADDIRIAVWLAIQDGRKYGVPLEVIAPPYRVANGISDHCYVTRALGIGTHTDCGGQFPWDFAAQVLNEHLQGASVAAPAVNAIDEQYKVTPWLGKKLTPELTCPDGRGRYAQFENGYIYWTPETGARPIPTRLFEVFAELGWEAGPLGYPANFHTVLPAGDVQAFERGVLYRKYDQPGFYVHGLIGARWSRTGYENGPFGWPTSNEQEVGDGRVQQFEHGQIAWSPDGTIALQPADGPDTILPDVH